jgi:hypothetical protein
LDGRRQVDFEEHSNGTVTFEEWFYSEETHEQSWFPVKRSSWSICDSL